MYRDFRLSRHKMFAIFVESRKTRIISVTKMSYNKVTLIYHFVNVKDALL